MSEPELIAKALRALAVTTGVAESQIMGNGREEEFVLCRQLLIYIMRYNLGLGVRETARMLGKPFSTVQKSLDRADFLIRYDRKAKRIYGQVVNRMANVHDIN